MKQNSFPPVRRKPSRGIKFHVRKSITDQERMFSIFALQGNFSLNRLAEDIRMHVLDVYFPLFDFLILSRYKRENSSRRKSFRLRYDNFDDVTYLQHCHSSQRWSCNLLHSSITLLSRFRLAFIQIHRANSTALCLFENTNWLQSLGFRPSLMSVLKVSRYSGYGRNSSVT